MTKEERSERERALIRSEYQKYSTVLLVLWMDKIIMDAEYIRIMDRLNKRLEEDKE